MLQHVSIEVPPSDADRMIEFWGLLGFEELEAPERIREYVRWVERDGTQIHLILTEAAAVPRWAIPPWSRRTGTRPSRRSGRRVSSSSSTTSSGASLAASRSRPAVTGSR